MQHGVNINSIFERMINMCRYLFVHIKQLMRSEYQKVYVLFRALRDPFVIKPR